MATLFGDTSEPSSKTATIKSAKRNMKAKAAADQNYRPNA
jgi:hypothetical protein